MKTLITAAALAIAFAAPAAEARVAKPQSTHATSSVQAKKAVKKTAKAKHKKAARKGHKKVA
jgi:opacity protein-like surface antigen